MNAAPNYSYHRATLAHLGLDAPGPSADALAYLDERERACGVPFPAAVREWYALAAGLMKRDLDFGGPLLPLDRLGEPYPHLLPDMKEYSLDFVAERRLLVMFGDYSEHLFAVDLDGSQNPPVSVGVMFNGSPVRSVSEIPWYPHAVTFSAFVLGTHWLNAWIHRTGSHGLFIYQRQLPSERLFSIADLDSLRTRFDEGPRTVNDPFGFMTTRFTGRGVAFEIRDVPDDGAANGDERPCDFDAFALADRPVELRDWHVKAESDDALVRFASDLRECGLLNRVSMYIAFNNHQLESILKPICVPPDTP